MELLLPSGPEPEPESEKVAPPSVPPGEKKPSPRYTVQVAAIPVGNRDKAEQYLKRHNALTPELLVSEDQKYLRVIVGDFPDRRSALEKRDELRKRKEFSDCFVRVRYR